MGDIENAATDGEMQALNDMSWKVESRTDSRTEPQA
jgi:hypothetical protein